MPTPGEKRALLFIAGIAALGVAARGFKELRSDQRTLSAVPAAGALSRQIEAVDSAIAVDGARRRRTRSAQATAAPPPVRAPRVRAPSGSSAGRSSGSRGTSAPGTALPLGADDPHEAYHRRWERQDAERRRANAAGARPGTGTGRAGSKAGRTPTIALHDLPPVDLDLATVEEVAALPMIGPALARRIVSDRIDHGPFGSLAGLERVRGIGPALARRLQPYVTFSLASRLESDPKESPASRRRRRP